MLRHVHWAIDPYSDVSATWERSLEALGFFVHANKDIQITPIYFLNRDALHWVSNVTPSQIDSLKPVVEKVMASRIKEFSGIELQPPEVVVCDGQSARGDMKLVAEYLAREKSDLIVINTHARKGFQRLFLGSFAENLLLSTKIPMLFISPNTASIESVDHAFYPTDFDESGSKIFLEYLDSAAGASKELTLYSKVISPISSFAEGATHALGGGWISVDQYLSKVGVERNKAALKWKVEAEKRGLKVNLNIDESPGPFLDDILKAVDESHCDIVVAPSFASRSETIFIGSVARQLIRHCNIPVLTRHEMD